MHKRKSLVPILLAIFLLAGWVSLPSTPAVQARTVTKMATAAFVSHCTGVTPHAIYNVGTGQTYSSIGAVPFGTLVAGDIVRVHYRATPYFEKIAISTSGTSALPICLIGVPGPNGELPIIDGNHATTSANMIYDYDGMQQRGLLTIMGQDWGDLPSYINIEGLHFRNAYSDFQFTTAAGQTRNYTTNAAAVHVQRGEHIRVTGCILSDSGNGLFAATSGDVEMVTRDLTLEYSYIHDNGSDVDREHNVYTEAIGMIYQFNRFGPTKPNSGGNNIKDRSSGTIIRYNWIEGGAHLIDLVEGQDGYDLLSQQPDYNKAWVYGNILVNLPNSDTQAGYAHNGANTVHFGGDSGDEVPGASSICGFGAGEDPTECYRKGPLYFYNNTVILYMVNGDYWDGGKNLLRLQTNEQSASVFNNIIHVIGNGSRVFYGYRRGVINFGVNLVNPGSNDLGNFYSQQSGATVTGTANLQILSSGSSTGFVNEAAKDFHLIPGSPAVNKGQSLPGGTFPVDFEYVTHQGSQPRNNIGLSDLGAYELAIAAGAMPGVYKDGVWSLRYTRTTGSADLTVNFGGDSSDWPVVGDWNGDGVDTIGIYRRSTGVFFLSDSNTTPTISYNVVFGNPSDTPFAGKWTADVTHDGLGVFRPTNGILYQKKQLTTGFSDYFAIFGNPGDKGYGGDFDGNGFDSIGVYRASNTTWYMTNNSQPGGITFSDIDFVWDIGTNLPIIADWNGDNISTIGHFNSSSVFTLHSPNATAGTDEVFTFGPLQGFPVAGRWLAGATPPLTKPSLNGVLVTDGSTTTNNTESNSAD